MSDVKQIDELAKIGQEMIEFQLTLSSKEIDGALDDLWALGYCFGIFDAMGQRAKLDQYTDGISLITIWFLRIMGGHLEGADKVRQSLDNQTDSRFVHGNQTGGSDLFAWFADTSKPPMALFKFLTSARDGS